MQLLENEVHVWYAYEQEIKDSSLLEKYYQYLSVNECAQYKRWHFDADRHRYLITRALVRCVLSQYVPSVLPAAWQFASNQYGKPHISQPATDLAQRIHFNLSHTEQLIVLAIAVDREVGVDVECLHRQRTQLLDVACSEFAAEEIEYILSLPATARRENILALWTLKEAYIKARGLGLYIPLNKFAYTFGPDARELHLSFADGVQDTVSTWQIWQMYPRKLHVVALALQNINTPLIEHVVVREVVPDAQMQLLQQPIVRATSGTPVDTLS